MRRKDKPEPSPLAAGTAERLAAIVEAAERAAVQVIDDAEEQARHHLGQARAEADRLAAERLRALADELDPPSTLAPRAAPEAGRGRAGAAGAGAGPDAPERPDAPDRGTPAGARLLATQMAVSGSSREEIAARLRNGFEIEDTASILDAILGPEE